MEEEIDLRDYINLIKKRWKVIVSITLIAGITTTAINFLKPPVYETYALINIGKSGKVFLEPMDNTIAEVMSDSTLSIIGKKIGKSKNEIKGKIEIEKKGGLLKIKTNDYQPEDTLKLNKAISAYVIQKHHKLLVDSKGSFEKIIEEKKKLIIQTEKNIADLKNSKIEADALKFQAYVNRYTELQLSSINDMKNYADFFKPTEELTPAFLPEVPVPQPKKRNIVLAVIVGLIAGIFCAFIFEYFKKENI